MQQLTGMTSDKMRVLSAIIKESETPMWSCYYAMLKTIRRRKLLTDCENLEASIKWAKTMPRDYLAKKLIAYRSKIGCK
jgi:hypothetical protein